MRALVLAPQPFYSERGTPISEANLLRMMAARGWSVDLLTYAQGDDLELPGLRIHRTPRIPFVADVPPGFSSRKIASDVVMTIQAIRMARTGDYDVVHGLEEAVFIAAAIRKLTGIPYVYDMDSLLSEQLVDRYPLLEHVRGILQYFEEVAVEGSMGVIAVCSSLAAAARRLSPRPFVARLEDRSQLGPTRSGADSLRSIAGADRTIALYVGNLESYQGIDLLLEGFASAVKRAPRASLVVIGGSDENIRRYRRRADELGLNGSAHLIGPRPVRHLRSYLQQADVLVSPRISGTNTPMKIYSYLDAGVPLLATRLPTHLQVLDDRIACLFEPTPAALAESLVDLIEDVGRRRALARNATRRVDRLYSRQAYQQRASRILREIERQVAVAGGGSRSADASLDVEAPAFSRTAGTRSPGTTHPSDAAPRRGRRAARTRALASRG